jgi:ABC-type multidrug transport system fused ATPase/permease subunit
MGFIVYGISQGNYSVGFLILFYGYFGNILQSIGELAEITQDYIVAKLAVGRMMDLLHEPVTIDREDEKLPFPEDWEKIIFKNISFLYGENAVLENVSFSIKRGERIGVVGLSGAGKSTLFKLLLKEHEDYTGEILIDDTPLRAISKSSYFVHAAPVLQDTEVFNFSLRNNITLANENEASNEELFERALRVSHVADFVPKLPKGVETLIGEKGVKLSGGERQRVGIARAVFKNPQILLLDEATSHLDVESEEKIRTSLHEFFQSVTAIVIAHRLTTIRGMDRILVLENGHIIEDGTFEELIKKQGRFFELWEKQKF